MTIADIYKILDLHFNRADQAVLEIAGLNLDAYVFECFDTIKMIDTFIYRFSKIQDYMGERLFPAVLRLSGDYKSFMTFKDILNTLERLELIISAEQWMQYRELRNILTHEYPDNEDEIIDGIKIALTVYTEMKNIYGAIKLKYF